MPSVAENIQSAKERRRLKKRVISNSLKTDCLVHIYSNQHRLRSDRGRQYFEVSRKGITVNEDWNGVDETEVTIKSFEVIERAKTSLRDIERKYCRLCPVKDLCTRGVSYTTQKMGNTQILIKPIITVDLQLPK